MLNKKAFVIGLDCLTPQLLFEEYLEDLPTIKGLLKKSIWGRMRSTIPPITCPAWATMVTSKNPGRLGIYGFRNRIDYSYERLALATSNYVKEPTIWDIIEKYDRSSIVIGVPPSYPPKRIKGIMTGCFLTPGEDSNYTYPLDIKDEIKRKVGKYIIDVNDFRTDDKDRLLKDIYDLSRNRFGVVKYLMKRKPWDFFMFVDMGPDRVHHGFWKYSDPMHKKYKKGNKYENAIRDYYRFLDSKIKELLNHTDEETTVYIVSDHGAKKIDGGFCINEWLIKEKYLVLKRYPKKVRRLEPDMVDWTKTAAWGEGGYYARIFLNIKGREPKGIVERKDYKSFRDSLIKKLKSIKYKNSTAKETVVSKPEELYQESRGIPPDLFVFFGDLLWRSVGSVGFNDIYTFENDTGPDDANHDYDGIFIMYDKKISKPRRLNDMTIYDFAPAVLNNMGIRVPKDMEGDKIKIDRKMTKR